MRSTICIIIMMAMVLCVIISATQSVTAEGKARFPKRKIEKHSTGEAKGSEMVSLDFDNVTLPLVAKFVSDVTGKDIVVRDDIKNTFITIKSAEKIPVSDLLKTFESELTANGLTMVPKGEIMEIVPSKK